MLETIELQILGGGVKNENSSEAQKDIEKFPEKEKRHANP